MNWCHLAGPRGIWHKSSIYRDGQLSGQRASTAREACWSLAFILLSGCATAIPEKPIVQTVEVKVPIFSPCRTTMPQLPLWELSRISPDASMFDLVKAIAIEVKQRQQFEALLTAAILACAE